MTGALRRWLQPSLVRRLVLAQMATAALLWLALAAYTAIQFTLDADESDLDQMRMGAALVLPLAQALEGQPALLQQTLQRIDEFQRAAVLPRDAQSGFQMPCIFLWREGVLAYRSSDAPPDFAIEAAEALREVSVGGRPWRAYAEDSADKRWRFAALAPATAEAFGLTPWSQGWLVLPLLVSLPLLLLPAWWSVRFALRPWAQVSGEIEMRGPEDLAPLRFSPVHRELSPLTAAVNQLLARMRASRERERSFIADAAHELRTPIAAIQVNAEALNARGLAPHDTELLQGLLNSNDRAGRLVSQLLALTRSDTLTNPRLTADVDLATLVQESLAQSAPLAWARDVRLDLESPSSARVRGDPESLRMLVDNLVGNAIKYSPPGATVWARLHCDAATVQLDVIDEGPGIAPELRARVCDRFFRVAGQTAGGSGLGLAIAKSVADRHHATLEFRDGPGGPGSRGLTVVVRLAAPQRAG